MSDQPDLPAPQPQLVREHTVREVRTEAPVGIVAVLADLFRSVMAGLPPAFVMLCLINLLFLALMVRFVENQADARTALVTKIIDSCLSKQ